MPRTDQPAKTFEVLVIDDEPEIRELLAEHLVPAATAWPRRAMASLLSPSSTEAPASSV